MVNRSAEDSFQRGMEALALGRRLEALALFEGSIAVERQLGGSNPQPRYLSYYGLCLALEGRKLGEGIEFCREAVSEEFYNADLYWNFARVLLAGGRRREGHKILLQGLRWDRGHAGLLRELRAMGKRRRPVFPFLSRKNPLNVLFGRMMQQRRPPRPFAQAS